MKISHLKLHFFFVGIFMLVFIVTINAQFTIQGKVVDGATGNPLAFANVFIANSTHGTNTDDFGKFVLKNIPKGNQELVVSYIGYENQIKKIVVSKLLERKQFEIKLQPSSTDLTTINVNAIVGKKRQRFLKKFTKAFLGTTPNASKCEILNPEVLDFQVNRTELTVTAQDLIVIKNRGTGYELKFLLEKFRMKGSQVTYAGKPLFKELSPAAKPQANHWARQRRITYFGSPRHFFESLANGNLKQEGFRIYLAKQKSDSEFATLGELLPEAILKDIPNSKMKFLTIVDFLKVVYLKEVSGKRDRRLGNSASSLGHPAERDFIEQSKDEVGNSDKFQTSYLYSRKTRAKLDEHGRLADPELMLQYGYWATERIADLLPFDYSPKTEDENIDSEEATAPIKKDFRLSKLTIPVNEIKDGGPPRDGIPSIDDPQFLSVASADFLEEDDYVLGVNYNGVAKAYPISILNRHEIG